MKHTRWWLIVAVIAVLAACGGDSRQAGPVLADPAGVAISGYDTVAYFTDGRRVKGSSAFSARYNDTTWWFSSAEHRDLFQESPERYAPAYGGWCAYGMAEGYAAETDPVNGWTIHQGRLYLNWDAEITADWRADMANKLKASEANWPTVNAELNRGDATVYWHD